ncbi:hypothetical protein CYMTET_28607 [Cymbomonas tetramitiformis]|uniref:Nudix hydrolase domain-containing protein n=1 Tax=Cymbomonas tetramitiformis TaxID=36881 RepID=A0AAE0FN60_9CHLO|nr:hypothetical protein CYMTET_28607 [Cymbomonas tetramitiformis]
MFAKVYTDRYGGVKLSIDKSEEAMKGDEFSQKLAAMLDTWRAEGKRGVWLKIPTDAAHLVPEAIKHDFVYHHASPAYLMLVKWMITDSKSSLPLYAHHQVGVGGLVLNEKNEVLVVQEKSGVTAGMQDFWKLPGGRVDPGEDLQEAAVREVLEETGVKTEFVSIATLRESHTGNFSTTDMYFICCLRLSSEYNGSTPDPVPQEQEIAACRWLPLDEFLGSKYYKRGLYGRMLQIAANEAKQIARHEPPQGLQVLRMKGLGGRQESMYFVGKAKL